MPEGFRIAEAYVEVDVAQQGIDRGIAMIEAKLKAIKARGIDIGINQKELDANLADAVAKLNVLKKRIEIGPINQAELSQGIAEIKAKMAAVQKDLNIHVEVEGADKAIAAMTALNVAQERMAQHMTDFVKISTLNVGGGGGRFWWVQWAHWIIAGGSELAAVVVPAAIALGSAMAVAAQGAQMAHLHMVALWTAAEATSQYLHQTLGTALGLHAALQQAQNAANPKVYQAMGAAIDIIKQHVLSLAGTGLTVLNEFDKFLAHFQYSLGPGGLGGNVTSLLHDMVPDLVMIGQIFGNLGHALLNFAADMPGLAGGMLLFLDAVSKVILEISKLPGWLITSIMVIEEMWRWGGLAATVLARLSGAIASVGELGVPIFARFGLIFSTVLKFIPMTLAALAVNLGGTIQKLGLFGEKSVAAGEAVGGFGLKLVGAAEFMGGPWGMAIAGAVIGLGLLFFALFRSKDATEQWIGSMNKSLEAANNLKALNLVQTDLVQTGNKLAAAQEKASQSMKGFGAGAFGAAGSGRFGAMGASAVAASRDIGALAAEHVYLTRAMQNTLAGAGLLVNMYHTSFIGALTLATNAGVKLQDGIIGQGQAASIARFQIADYVRGLQAMGQPLGAIGNDMSALAIQSGLASTKVSQLNSAWDDFMNNVTGGTNAFSQFTLSIQGLGQTALKNTASLKGTISSIDLVKKSAASSSTAANGFANSLTGLGQNAAQTWQQFNAVVTGPGQQMLDWFRTAGAEGQVTAKDITYSVRAIINQLLPMAEHSKTATAELSAMAQQAGGPFTTNFQTLKHWVDEGGHSMGGLGKIVDITTQKMADMSKVAQALGTTMQQDIIQTMDAAQLKSSGLAQAIQSLTDYINKNGVASIKQSGAYQKVHDILTRLTGSTDTATSTEQAYIDKVFAGNRTLSQAHDMMHAYNGMVDENNHLTRAGQPTRQQLINDLAAIGRNAHLGTGEIATMISKITHIPRRVIIDILEQGIGHFSISQYKQAAKRDVKPGGFQEFHQLGGRIAGYGGGDIVPVMVEPGEAIVPKHLVPLVSGILGSHNVPGFQTGGIAQTGNLGVDTGTAPQAFTVRFQDQITTAMERAMTSAMKQQQAQAQQAMMFQMGRPGYGGSTAAMSFAKSMLGAYGWGGQWPALYSLWMQESGWNPYAVNASSGAYGIPQSLGHGHPYNLGDFANQIRWGLAYIASVYGSPNAAWAHEVAHNWYAKGTEGAMPGWAVVGERGPEMVRFLGGEIVLPTSVSAAVRQGRARGYATGTGGAVGGRVIGPSTTVTGAENAGAGGVTVVQQFYGTQYPTPEQSRRMNIDLAMALGVAP